MTVSTPTWHYVVALGSNRRGRHGTPVAEVRAAMVAIGAARASPILTTAPLGPSRRRFANAAMLIASDEPPPQLLRRLKGIERDFGRRRGRRWDSRVIDLDIVLWSGGRVVQPRPDHSARAVSASATSCCAHCSPSRPVGAIRSPAAPSASSPRASPAQRDDAPVDRAAPRP